MSIPLLPASPVGFPNPQGAMADPDGLLAAGGDLTIQWLIEAYAQGIFPWFDSDDDPIFWWSPSTRAVSVPGDIKVSRSLAKRIRNAGFEVRADSNFAQVIDGCRAPRSGSQGTWITDRMKAAYVELHQAGFAHSLETYLEGELVGGLYGVSLGLCFFGESMFSAKPDASKIAFYALHQQLRAWGFQLIDCQIQNPHLETLGVQEMSRRAFLEILSANPLRKTRKGLWQLEGASAKF